MDESTASDSAVYAAREIRVVFSRIRRRLKDASDNRELTPSQTSVLSRLSKEGPASMSALAAAERVRPQSMAATLANLDERGFTQRRPDPDDGRRQLISLSDPGREFVEGKRRAGEEWLVRALDERLSERERRTVIEAMALIERLDAP